MKDNAFGKDGHVIETITKGDKGVIKVLYFFISVPFTMGKCNNQLTSLIIYMVPGSSISKIYSFMLNGLLFTKLYTHSIYELLVRQLTNKCFSLRKLQIDLTIRSVRRVPKRFHYFDFLTFIQVFDSYL